MRYSALRAQRTSEVHDRRTREDATRGGREERTPVPGRVLLLAAVVLLAVLFAPGKAFAATGGVLWGPGDLPGGQRGVVVGADSSFDAAAMALGYSYTDIQSWSPEIKAKLSNASTGGNFYTFSQKFADFNDSVDLPGYLAPLYEAVGSAFFAVAESLYGNDIWLAAYDQDLGLNAAWDLKLILQGESIGGGGSTPLPGDGTYVYVPITLFDASIRSFNSLENGPVYSNTTDGNYAYSLSNTRYYLKQYSNDSRPMGSDFSIGITKTLYDDLMSRLQQVGWDDAAIYATIESSSSFYTLRIYIVHKGSFVRYVDKNGNFVAFSYPVSSEYYSLSLNDARKYYPRTWPATVLELQDSIRFSATSVSTSTKNVQSSSLGVLWNTYLTGSSVFDASGVSGGGGGEPVVPPTNWPDEPQAPEPPELPEPGTNPTVNPTPWSPVIDLPDLSFDLNITADPTSEDILDWVKKIYFELKAFHRDAQQWFTEISDSFEDIVSAINNMNSQIYAQLQRMDSNVSSEFQQTRTYLHRLFQWLANQLDFDNDPYNDSNVIYWLKQIWSKLGGGINTRPTDPTSDPENWWDWLIKAIQNFLIGLAATSSELISDFADVISQVMHQFPFSIPWDIAAYLAAFAAAPVTPEVTITIPAVEGWWASFDYHISMSAFDTAAATIRTMEKILFAAFLAWKSRDLLDFMDVTKWFNG